MQGHRGSVYSPPDRRQSAAYDNHVPPTTRLLPVPFGIYLFSLISLYDRHQLQLFPLLRTAIISFRSPRESPANLADALARQRLVVARRGAPAEPRTRVVV